jgi:AP-1-like factor
MHRLIQNRNAQRAFRERKERVVKDLEDKVSELQRNHENTVSENQSAYSETALLAGLN